MKKSLTLLCILNFVFILASAQDVIVMKNGDEVKAKVTEIGTNEIKYKKFDNPDGPVYSATKSDVFMIKYENGTKDMISSSPTSSAAAATSSQAKAKSVIESKPYTALIYGGLSIPIGSFSKEEEGGAKTGFTFGHEGDIHISNNSAYFTYNLNYTSHSYGFSFYDPYSYIPDEFTGSYGLIYVLAGFKFKTNTSVNRFYFLFNGGLNILNIGGDLGDFTIYNGYGNSHLTTDANNSFAFSAGMGVEINSHFNLGLKYFNSKSEFTTTVTYTDPYYGTQTEKFKGEQKIELIQLIFGYAF